MLWFLVGPGWTFLLSREPVPSQFASRRVHPHQGQGWALCKACREPAVCSRVSSQTPRVHVSCVCLAPLTSDPASVSRPVLPPDQSTGRHLTLCPVSRILSKERSLDSQCRTCPEMPHTGVLSVPPPRSKRALRCQHCPKPPPTCPSPAQETPPLFTRPEPPATRPHLVHGAAPFQPCVFAQPSWLSSSGACSVLAHVQASCPCLACLEDRTGGRPHYVPTPVRSARLWKGSFVHVSTPWWPVSAPIACFPAYPLCRVLVMWRRRRRGVARGRAGPQPSRRHGSPAP